LNKRSKNQELKSSTIKYYSTNLKAPEVTFSEALLKGLAPDGGLYMPSSIPSLNKEEIESLFFSDYQETAFLILKKFLSDEMEESVLMNICRDAYSFRIPLERVFNRNYVLRLDQGPTASFKDFAAQVMSRLMNYYASLGNNHLTVLTATSGDTGSAIANAYQGLGNIKVIILFPFGEVTEIQRKQMTTLGKNIRVIAIDGKFDDCQRLVKQAFNDITLSGQQLSSANSINIGRLLPQSVYYFYSWSKLATNPDEKIIFSVPSGNYGNLMGGIIAREMGLPVEKFIISTNSNDEVPRYLATGVYNIINPSVNCISSAMNVGHPSNFARIIALYGGIMDENGTIIKVPDLDKLRRDFYGISISDEDTRETILESYRRYRLILEPHGAIAWRGLEIYQNVFKTADQFSISLETAHPAKFNDELSRILGFSADMPDSLMEVIDKTEDFIKIENSYPKLKDLILNH
jgi:threonine synthase